MLFVLKNGNRVWYPEDITTKKDITDKTNFVGVLLCVVKLNGDFRFSFCKADILEAHS